MVFAHSVTFSQIKFHACLSADINWQSGVIPQPMGSAGGKELPSELDNVRRSDLPGKQAQGTSRAGSSQHNGCKCGMERSRNPESGLVGHNTGEESNSKYCPRWGSRILCVRGTTQMEVFDLVSFQSTDLCK